MKVEDAKYSGYIVYCYWQPEADKMYVGITGAGSIKARARGRYRGYNRCAHLQSAIEKYGWDSFAKDVLQYGLTKEEAEEWEKYYISEWDLTNPQKGYNIQNGGYSTGGLSEEGRQRLSELNSGGSSPVALKVVSFSAGGEKLREFDCLKDAEVFYGLPLTTLTRGSLMGSSPRGGYYFRRKADVGDIEQLPQSEMKLYNDRSVFVGANASHAIPVVLFDKVTGRRIAEFGCAKDASVFAGVNVIYCMEGANKTCGDFICYKAEDVIGVDVLPDLDKHKPLTYGKTVVQYSLEGNLIAEYESAREAERATGISFKAIHMCVAHKSHSSGGYVWRYSGDPFEKPVTAWETRVVRGKSSGKPVDQIDLSTGEIIATYPSISEAAKAVGSFKTSISAVARHIKGNVSAAGYGWQFHSE